MTRRILTYVLFLQLLLACKHFRGGDSGGGSGGPQPSEEQTEKNKPSSEGEGVAGYLVGYENARIRCDFETLEPAQFKILCSAVAAQSSGEEIKGEELEAGTTITWPPAATVIAGEINSGTCTATDDQLSWSCEVDLVSNQSTLKISAIVARSQKPKREESSIVLLPVSALSLAGDIPYLDHYVPHKKDKSKNSSGDQLGFQISYFPFDAMPLEARSMCKSKLGFFFTDNNLVFRCDKGKKEYCDKTTRGVSRWAGNPQVIRSSEVRHRLDAYLGYNLRIACADNAVYVADYNHGNIWKFKPNGEAHKLAGQDILDGLDDLRPENYSGQNYFFRSADIALSPNQELYIADSSRTRIVKVDTDGEFSVVYEEQDPQTEEPQVHPRPISLAVGKDGSFFILMAVSGQALFDVPDSAIVKITPDKRKTTLYQAAYMTRIALSRRDELYFLKNSGAYKLNPDGRTAKLTDIKHAHALLPDHGGGVYIATNGSSSSIRSRIVKVAPQSGAEPLVTSVVGPEQPPSLGDDGPASKAAFAMINSIALLEDGSVAFHDYQNENIRIIDPSNNIFSVAKNQKLKKIASDQKHNIYATHYQGISKIDPKTGAATSIYDSPFTFPGIAFAADKKGNAFVANGNRNTIAKINKDGSTIIAGTGQEGYSGDGGLATNAQLTNPYAIAVTDDGSVIFAASGPYQPRFYSGQGKIRKIDPNGIISTIAGAGSKKEHDDPRELVLPSITAMSVDGAGNIYVIDQTPRLYKLKPNSQGHYDMVVLHKSAGVKKCSTDVSSALGAKGNIDEAIKSSLSVMCFNRPSAIAASPYCREGRTFLVFAQYFGNYPSNGGHLVKVNFPCDPKL